MDLPNILIDDPWAVDNEIVQFCVAKELLDRQSSRRTADPGVRPWDGTPYRFQLLRRQGFSGARIYVGSFNQQGAGQYAIKVNESDDIDREIHGLDQARDLFHQYNLSHLVFDANFQVPDGLPKPSSRVNGMGAIWYPFTAGQSRGSTDLADMLREQWQEPHSRGISRRVTPAEIITQVYRRCDDARTIDNVIDLDLNLVDEFYEYWDRGTPMEAVLRDFYGDRLDSKESYGGCTIADPRIAFRELVDGPMSVRCGPVHGDLHPNNVVIDGDQNAHLIDFAWAKRRFATALDHVIMECSLRFIAFPRRSHPDFQLKWDLALAGYKKRARRNSLSNTGFFDTGWYELDYAARVLSDQQADNSRHSEYHSLLDCISTIREAANTAGVSAEQYFAVQFVILYGLLSLPPYHSVSVARTLGLLSRSLLEYQ